MINALRNDDCTRIIDPAKTKQEVAEHLSNGGTAPADYPHHLQNNTLLTF